MAETNSTLELQDVPIVTLLVGPNKATYHVHLSLLCNASSYFKAAFADGRFQEGESRKIELLEDDVSAVGRLVQWLYSRTYTLSPWETAEETNDRFWQLARLNTLADKYDMSALTNGIVDGLFVYHSEKQRSGKSFYGPQIDLVSYVYENTTEKSSFRKYVVAWYAWAVDIDWYDKSTARERLLEVHHDFTVDLAMALGQRLAFPSRVDPFTLPSSVYYEDEKPGGSEEKKSE